MFCRAFPAGVLNFIPNRLIKQPVTFLRFTSSFTKEEIALAQEWLDSFTPSQIPKDHFTISFSRSSGPGGQKVNKTSSKATIQLEPHVWLNPYYCSWIPKPVLQQITDKVRYQTKSGGILIQCDTTRNRETNTDECFKRLLQEIKDNVYFAKEASQEDVEKWKEIEEISKEKRMFNKKKVSDKKKSRSKKFDI